MLEDVLDDDEEEADEALEAPAAAGEDEPDDGVEAAVSVFVAPSFVPPSPEPEPLEPEALALFADARESVL